MIGETPSERSQHARQAAYQSWAQTEDRTERTSRAREAFLDRFERQVDPDGLLDPAERALRAEFAKKAHFAAMARKSAISRRKKAELQAVA